MFEFIIEIYDTRYHVWYQDFTTTDIDIAESYFNKILAHNDKGCIRMITRFKGAK